MYTNHGVFGGAWRSNIKLALIVDVSFNLKKKIKLLFLFDRHTG